MSEIVDKWVDKLGDLPNIGEMTHTERMMKAFDLQEPDMVPAAPQLDYWQIRYAGYDYRERPNSAETEAGYDRHG